MQQAVRTGVQTLRSSLVLSHPRPNGAVAGLLYYSRVFSSQSAAALSNCGLDKQHVTTRLVDLLKSIPFVDPIKVTSTAKFREDLQLDTLEKVEVVMAVEEEFAVDIPDTEANKFSTTAHIIDYIAAHPQAK